MRIKTVLIFTFFLLLGISGFSQEGNKREKREGTADTEFIDLKDRKDWSFKVAPYAWLAGTATDVGSEQIRQSFNDLVSLTNFGFQVVAQAKYKKWSLSTNLTYAKLGDIIQDGPLIIDFGVDQVILDSKIGYTIIDKINFGDNVIHGWAMEATIGAIYWSNIINLNADLDSPGDLIFPISLRDNLAYVDLVIGTNYRVVFSKSVLLSISANVGGFGIGNSSVLYWDLLFANTFKVSELMTVTAGYKTFTDKTVSGEGADKLEVNIKTFGPLLGVAFNF